MEDMEPYEGLWSLSRIVEPLGSLWKLIDLYRHLCGLMVALGASWRRWEVRHLAVEKGGRTVVAHPGL